MSKVQRKPWICMERDCTKCHDFDDFTIPEGCEFEILHALDINTVGIQEMSRRSGKTTKLVLHALQLAEQDIDVTIVCPNENMVRYLVDNFRLKGVKNIEVTDIFKVKSKFSKLKNGRRCVFTDELQPDDILSLHRYLPEFCHLVRGFYTRTPSQ